MNKVIVIPNATKDCDLSVTAAVTRQLSALGMVAYVSDVYARSLSCDAVFYADIPGEADLIVVVGGDGSIIDASATALSLGIPILGVNLGRVGYLSEIEPQKLSQLSALVSGEYTIEERMLLTCRKFNASGEEVLSSHPAVNDIVVSHNEYLGIGELCVSNSHGDSVKYRADGVIASTPTGSTAYSLSAGGPIIAHDLQAITVTPVCPHSFFNRAIVFGADEIITVTNEGSQMLKVSVDGRFFADLDCGECVTVKKYTESLKVVTFKHSNMFSTISSKIKTLDGAL